MSSPPSSVNDHPIIIGFQNKDSFLRYVKSVAQTLTTTTTTSSSGSESQGRPITCDLGAIPSFFITVHDSRPEGEWTKQAFRELLHYERLYNTAQASTILHSGSAQPTSPQYSTTKKVSTSNNGNDTHGPESDPSSYPIADIDDDEQPDDCPDDILGYSDNVSIDVTKIRMD